MDIKIRKMMYAQMWRFDPYRQDTLEAAKRLYKGPSQRQKYEYQCNMCRKWFVKSFVEVDHIEARGTYLLPEHEEGYRQRTFTKNLQILCKKCHKTVKTPADMKKIRQAKLKDK